MKIAAIALTNLRRLMRDRIGLFFIFIFPIVIIVTIGAVFGEDAAPRIGLYAGGDGPLQDRLVSALEDIDGIDVVSFSDRAGLVSAVERGAAASGVVVPPGYDDTLRNGETAALVWVSPPGGFETLSLRSIVQGAVDEQSALVGAARFAQRHAGISFDQALRRASLAAMATPRVQTEVDFAQGDATPSEGGRFDTGAAQQLVLFMFLTSLSASAQLIRSRRLGVSRRMISTPTTVRTVLFGETVGRFGVAMVQGLFIVFASALLFGVAWGNPVGTGLIVVAFALVGTGAAMLFGALFENDEQASAVGTFAGLGLAALGGCMVPSEVFSDTMQRISHITPHAWALDGLFDLIVDSAGVNAIVPELAVLAAFAAVLLGSATLLLRRTMTG